MALKPHSRRCSHLGLAGVAVLCIGGGKEEEEEEEETAVNKVR